MDHGHLVDTGQRTRQVVSADLDCLERTLPTLSKSVLHMAYINAYVEHKTKA